ncbi:MAG TPA: sensor histidine kinase [Acidimicrobiales bacterium]
MAGVAELAREYGGLDGPRVEHLQRLVRSWGLLADLSFSDLLLFGRADTEGPGKLVLLGQVRPTTAQTIYREDLVGALVDAEDRPIVGQAFRDGRITEGKVLLKGHREPVHVIAVPVRWHDEVLAVLTRESMPPLARPTSDLERAYNAVFGRLAHMIASGAYPFPHDQDVQARAPRVGDGVIVLDAAARVEYNSPNAVSALHRLGVHVSAEGYTLGELGLDDHFVRTSFGTRSVMFGELERGTEVTVVMSCIPLLQHDELTGHTVTGALVLVRDISELRYRDRLLLSKDATIREIHHRVKNNLQTISSLLRLQSRRLESEEARAAVEESVRRIGAIALVHETLAQEITEEAPFNDVVRPLVRMVDEGLSSPERPVRFEIVGDAGSLPADVTTPLAVVLSELLQNAVEHAYTDRGQRTGQVRVELGRHDDVLTVRVIDDGRGVPPEFSLEDARGLGLTIVRTLVENDLGGEIQIGPRTDGEQGTEAALRVPVRARKA